MICEECGSLIDKSGHCVCEYMTREEREKYKDNGEVPEGLAAEKRLLDLESDWWEPRSMYAWED